MSTRDLLIEKKKKKGSTYPEVVVGTLQETQGVIHDLRVIQSGSSAQE